MADEARVATVIGLGNPLMGDDGLGVLATRRLSEEWDVSPAVQVVDGGTWGMNLLPLIEDADDLLLIDAINAGLPPGSPVVLVDDEVPRTLATKLSPHQIDVREVLAVAQLRGRLPKRMVALGLQPGPVELGAMSPEVAGQVDDLLEAIANQLRSWGHSCESRCRAANA